MSTLTRLAILFIKASRSFVSASLGSCQAPDTLNTVCCTPILASSLAMSSVPAFPAGSLSRDMIKHCCGLLFSTASISCLRLAKLPSPTATPPASITLRASISPSTITMGPLSSLRAWALNSRLEPRLRIRCLSWASGLVFLAVKLSGPVGIIRASHSSHCLVSPLYAL